VSSYNEAIPDLQHIYLEDSWVRGVYESSDSLSFDLEAVLTEAHPLWVPRAPGEQHTYRRVALTFPNIRSIDWRQRGGEPATDASGEADWGHIDTLTVRGDVFELAGDWGRVVLTSDPPIVRDR
jgi:hypothetical protein